MSSITPLEYRAENGKLYRYHLYTDMVFSEEVSINLGTIEFLTDKDIITMVRQSEKYRGKLKHEADISEYNYLISDNNGFYKIGLSQNPDIRLKQISKELQIELKLLHSFPSDNVKESEELLHMRFGPVRIEGEWFVLSDKDVEYIMKISEYKNGKFYYHF